MNQVPPKLNNYGKEPDPRHFKKKVISYISIGGSDWVTRAQCDCEMLSMTPMWTTIDLSLIHI